ncbi:porin [uncultured Bacteroides sp.]|uniref:porin n=1 Tax=uncultured Bacteroides sp. TaxID=162156 RepID=UPI0026754790|nr:porin [uncultured Bacteroides sp.]
MKRVQILITFFLIGWMAVRANEPLQIKFRSRALLDATVSGYGTEKVQGYYRVEDFRLGFKATYEKFELKADVGMGGGKLAFKDLLLNYHFKNGVLSFGNSYEPFSMDMLISTADLRFRQSAASVLAFTNSRKLGITYHFYNEHW